MILTDNGGNSYQPCPAGSYLARCVQLIDMGTQTSTFDGETKRAKKVLVAWEILDSEVRKEDGSPFVLAKRFTQSLHEKAALRKELTSWRGRDFTPGELRGFELRAVLGKDAFVSVVQVAKDGKVFTNIAAVMKPPKGMVPQVASDEPLLHWDMGAPDWTVFGQLSSKLQEQISASPEYQAITPPKSVVLSKAAAPVPAPALPTRTAPPKAPAPAAFDDLDDDIPF